MKYLNFLSRYLYKTSKDEFYYVGAVSGFSFSWQLSPDFSLESILTGSATLVQLAERGREHGT